MAQNQMPDNLVFIACVHYFDDSSSSSRYEWKTTNPPWKITGLIFVRESLYRIKLFTSLMTKTVFLEEHKGGVFSCV